MIDDIDLAVNFIVVPDNILKSQILLGRDILSTGQISVTVLSDRYEFVKLNKEKNKDSKLKYIKQRKNKPVDKNSVFDQIPSTSAKNVDPSSYDPSQHDESQHDVLQHEPLVHDPVELEPVGSEPLETSQCVSPCDSSNPENVVYPIPCNQAVVDLQVESMSANEGPLPRLQGSTLGQSEKFDPLHENLDTDLEDSNDLAKLRSILNKYSDSFTRGLPRRAVTTAELNIKLKDPNKIVNRRPYRLHPRDREAVRVYIKEMLDAGIIEQTDSPWSSPCILVPKKNGKLRLCTDFRAVNENTIAQRFPIPLIQDQIARLTGQKYFISLDAASGFYGISVNESSRQILAFSTPDGHYAYRRMPFGIKNAPCFYQMAITNALGDLAQKYCLAYMDDLLIIGTTIEEMFSRLEEVLEKLRQAGFTLNPDKCSFLKTSIVYLGYLVKDGEVRPHNDRIRALVNLPAPKDRTALKSFLGFCSYFRSFVRDFSIICTPLYQLTSVKSEFKWTPYHEEIRQKLIKIFTSEPVLTIFDPNSPVEVWGDASSLGFGSILFNIIDGKRKVVGYFSRRTSPCEAKYHSYELETLCAVKAFKNWEHFLLYNHFTLVTDCRSFQLSFTKQTLITRVHRWWAYLQAFDFTIVHRPGSSMRIVDFFSRYPVGDPIEVDIFETSVDDYPPTHDSENYHVIQKMTKKNFPDSEHEKLVQKSVNLLELTGEWLQIAQLQDGEIQLILKKLDENSLEPNLAKTYVLREGVLCRKLQYKKKTHTVPIVPKAYKWVVTNSVHESILHMGPQKTMDAILSKFWFSGMNKFVKRFIENCITCKLAKPPSGKKQMELYPIPKHPVPFDTVHIDTTGRLSGQGGTPDYYIVQICAFTKYILLYHTKNLTAKSAINAVEQLISLFGAPSRLVYDQAGSFTANSFTMFCNQHNIKMHPIATGSSRANAQVERYMKNITSLLTVAQYIKKQSIKSLMPQIQLILNSTTNRVTTFSPIELLTGRRPEIPSTLYVEEDLTPPIRSDLEEIRSEAKQNIDRSQAYNLQRFVGTKAPVIPLKLDDLCLREVEARTREKTSLKFRGTYRVIEILPHDRYIIQNINSGKTLKYAHDRLRKITQDTSLLPYLLNEDSDVESDPEV